MAGKKIAFGAKPTTKPASLDEWVGTKPETDAVAPVQPETEKAKMKRLTFDIPEDMHRQLKLLCVQNGVQMADELRSLISQYIDTASKP